MTTNIKEIIAWKINWIKNASEICTAQAESLNRLTASTVPIKSVTKKDHGIYELLHKFPQKVYFDMEYWRLLWPRWSLTSHSAFLNPATCQSVASLPRMRSPPSVYQPETLLPSALL